MGGGITWYVSRGVENFDCRESLQGQFDIPIISRHDGVNMGLNFRNWVLPVFNRSEY